MKIILASTSPYRQELLKRLNLDFEAKRPAVDEDAFKTRGHKPQELAKLLAMAKAQSLFALHPDCTVIGSDQVIALENNIFSKPGTREAAIKQLETLRGKTHLLITAVAICSPQGKEVFTVDARCTLRQDLSPKEIERYVDHDSPLDCAGSYKLESLGIALFSNIECSDFTTITGLPLLALSARLRALGFQCP